MSLARRTVTSSAYSIAANIVEVVFLFGRAIALTRLLGPEVFGVYAFALSVVNFSLALPNFGLWSAFVHRTAESEDDKAVEVHFTLTALFGLIWTILMAAGVAIFAQEDQRWAFWVLVSTKFVFLLTTTPQVLLTRKVMFRRLALFQVISTIASSVAAVALAWYGFGVWSLLAINIVRDALAVGMFYGFRPVWRPRLGWSPPIVRYFLTFGSKVTVGNLLLEALDRVDDIWTGAALGNTALGFYNRAYGLATYPRRLLSTPLTNVAMGTYAQLKGDRERLSQFFFMVNALIVRFNFLLAGAIALAAPELIRLILGDQWLPMLAAFRLMLVYTLLDPIKLAVANVITISGAPEKVVRTRLAQLGVMVAGLALLVPRLGITGVALAVNLMLVVGIVVLLWQARAYVDFSMSALFGAPGLALVVGMALGHLIINLPGVLGSDWRTAGAKLGAFAIVYCGILMALERKDLPIILKVVGRLR